MFQTKKIKKYHFQHYIHYILGQPVFGFFIKCYGKTPMDFWPTQYFIYIIIYIYIHTYIHTHTHTYTYTQIYIKLTWVKSPFGLYGKTQMDFWPTQYFIEGNGTPLQYYCLENPMGRGAW